MFKFLVFSIDLVDKKCTPGIVLKKILSCDKVLDSGAPDFNDGYFFQYEISILTNESETITKIDDCDFYFAEPFKSIFDLMSKKECDLSASDMVK